MEYTHPLLVHITRMAWTRMPHSAFTLHSTLSWIYSNIAHGPIRAMYVEHIQYTRLYCQFSYGILHICISGQHYMAWCGDKRARICCAFHILSPVITSQIPGVCHCAACVCVCVCVVMVMGGGGGRSVYVLHVTTLFSFKWEPLKDILLLKLYGVFLNKIHL